MTNARSWFINATMVFLSLIFAVGVSLGIEYGARTSWLFWVEHWTSDWRAKFLSNRPKGQHPKIAVVKVNEDTIQDYAYRTPIDRGLIARLITVLDRAGVEAIAVDFLFLKETEPAKDEALIQAIKAAKTRVVLAVADKRVGLSDAQQAYQRSFIERSGATPGFANLLTAADGVVRFIAPQADKDYPKSLAVAAAKPDAEIPDGPRRIAWLLRPEDGNERFLELPAHLLAAPAGKAAPPTVAALSALLRGRIVFIGAELIGIDRHLTPLASWKNDNEVPGVIVHTHVAAQLLDDRSVTRVPTAIMRFVYALITFLGICVVLRYSSIGYSLYFSIITLTIAGADILLFIFTSQFLPFGACLAAAAAGLLGGIVMRYVVRLFQTASQTS